MVRFEGALARKLDFGGVTTTTTGSSVSGRQALRLAPPPSRLHGPDKYRVLEQRRRRAQMQARHAIDGALDFEL